MAIKNFDKDPDATLDFVFDWSDWLQSGESITSHDVTVPTGITLESDSESGGLVTAWLSGGTAGISYIVACEVTTDSARVDERSIRVVVADR